MKYRSHNDGAIVFALILAVLALIVGLNGCTDERTAERVLSQAGYTEIEMTGWRPFMRSEDDYYSTGFKAKAPNGAIVTGAVTSGLWLKGATIRFD